MSLSHYVNGLPSEGWKKAKSKEMTKKKEVAKKMKVKYSDEKHLLYRTFKNKDDYNMAHFKSTTIHPSKVNKKKITPKLEYRAKKAGFYKHGDPRFGDVYEP